MYLPAIHMLAHTSVAPFRPFAIILRSSCFVIYMGIDTLLGELVTLARSPQSRCREVLMSRAVKEGRTPGERAPCGVTRAGL